MYSQQTHQQHRSVPHGYPLGIAHTDDERQQYRRYTQLFFRHLGISLLLSAMLVLYHALTHSWLPYSLPLFAGYEWIPPIFVALLYAYGGLPFVAMAEYELRQRTPGLMTLISLAITGTFLYNATAPHFVGGTGGAFLWQYVVLVNAMLFAHWIEVRSLYRASCMLDELASLIPNTAERLRDDCSIVDIPALALQKGDMVLVRPNKVIPADGTIIAGESDVDESNLTGEPLLVEKGRRDRVFAGTANGNGSFRMLVHAVGNDTVLARIMRSIWDAQDGTTRSKLVVNKIVQWVLYIGGGVTALVGLAWVLVNGLSLDMLKRLIAFMLISSPPALTLMEVVVPVVATVTVTVGVTIAVTNGLLVGKRAAPGAARKLRTRGTLGIYTTAKERIKVREEHQPVPILTPGEAEHLVTQAFCDPNEQFSFEAPSLEIFETLKGKGVCATHHDPSAEVDGVRMADLFEAALPKGLRPFSLEQSERGDNVVYVAQEDDAFIAAALSEKIREESRRAIERLHELGIEVALPTEQRDSVMAETIAQAVEQAKQRQYGVTSSLQAAEIAFASASNAGLPNVASSLRATSASAQQSMQGMQEEVDRALRVVTMNRDTYRKMLERMVASTGSSIVMLPIAAGVFLPIGVFFSPAVGIFFMTISTIIVVINAQRQQHVGVAVSEV